VHPHDKARARLVVQHARPLHHLAGRQVGVLPRRQRQPCAGEVMLTSCTHARGLLACGIISHARPAGLQAAMKCHACMHACKGSTCMQMGWPCKASRREGVSTFILPVHQVGGGVAANADDINPMRDGGRVPPAQQPGTGRIGKGQRLGLRAVQRCSPWIQERGPYVLGGSVGPPLCSPYQ
jgi:hypothetical protein